MRPRIIKQNEESAHRDSGFREETRVFKRGSTSRDAHSYSEKREYGASGDDRRDSERSGGRFHSGRRNETGESRRRPSFSERGGSGRGERRERPSFRGERDERPGRSGRDERRGFGNPFGEERRSYRKSTAEEGREGGKRSAFTERRERPSFRGDGNGRPDRSGRDEKRGFKKPFEREREERRPYRKFDSEEKGRRDFKRTHKKSSSATPELGKTEEFGNDGLIRLNKFISNSGICSRREADEYITAGLVTVNGKVVTEMGVKVTVDDDVRFNGERIKGEKKVYIVMNKPKDFVTTMSDPHAERNVMELINKSLCPERVFPIGRLDKSTTGVLLFTNDGEMAEKLTHPSHQKKKIYQVTLDKNFKFTDMTQLVKGVELEDGMAYADEASYVGESKDQVGLEIHSGRNRIVRRMFEALGYRVRKLDRVYFAGLTKKNLSRGQWRFLTEEEVVMLKMNMYE